MPEPTGQVLEDVVDVVVGGTPSTKEPSYWEGPIVWVTPTDITSLADVELTSSARTLTDEGLARSSARLVPAGSVLVTTRATIGPAVLAGCEVATNQGVTALVPRNSDIDSAWLYYWVKANRNEFVRRGAGNTFPEISRSKTRQIPIRLPGYDEQCRVADLLLAFDRALHAARRHADSIVQMRRAYVAERWTEGRDWPNVGLPELVEILDKERVPVNESERAERPGDIPYFGAMGQVGWIDDYLFDEELVLLGEDGVPFFDPLGQKAYIVSGKTWVNNHAHVLRPRPGKISAPVLCAFLNRIDYGPYAAGGTRTKLTQAGMKRMTIPVPPPDVQERIDLDLQALDETLRRASAGRDSANVARDAAIHALFRAGHEITASYDRFLEGSSSGSVPAVAAEKG